MPYYIENMVACDKIMTFSCSTQNVRQSVISRHEDTLSDVQCRVHVTGVSRWNVRWKGKVKEGGHALK